MSSVSFFTPVELSLSDLVDLTGSRVSARSSKKETDTIKIGSAAPIGEAVSGQVTFLDNARYVSQLSETKATAVFCTEKYVERVPEGTVALVHERPYEAYGLALAALYPTAMRPQLITGEEGISTAAHVSASAQLEDGVTVEAGAVIGPEVSIGTGSVVLAGAVVGKGVQIGRDTTIGGNATVANALIGDSVIIHGGVQIGQDGFGFSMGPAGHKKIAQFGRVIIQDHVEVGANSTIDRGANRDTVIGEGTKIDNMVQIAHNVVTGRHCVIIAQSGIAGSTTLGDFVVVAAQSGIIGHLTIGDGVQVGGGSGVTHNVPPGEKVMGYPAISASIWMRQAAKQMLDAKKQTRKK